MPTPDATRQDAIARGLGLPRVVTATATAATAALSAPAITIYRATQSAEVEYETSVGRTG